MARPPKARYSICEQAQRLFNERGYDQVSLREIAEAAGTTIGNLTHHFPQKADIIAAIQENLHLKFANEFFNESEIKDTLANLYQSFANAQHNRENNLFYYRNLIELCNDSKTISDNNKAFRERLFHYYRLCFEKLVSSGLMRPDISERQYHTLAYTIVFAATGWIQNASPYYDEALPKIPLASALGDIIHPYFTREGLKRAQQFNSG